MAVDGAEYRDLVKVLNSKLSGEHHFVEILPEYWSLAPGANYELASDKKADGRKEHTIGIPKKVLVKAFLTAHRIFFSNLDDVETNKSKLLDSSMIILLFDPEHLTAANVRKKVALSYRELDEGSMIHHLGHELWLTEFFLMSRLKRHNKSPTLWAHRKWLMENFKDQTMKKRGGVLEPEGFDMHEIAVLVHTSAEHHPRNYYAWDYLRWWVGEYAPRAGFPEQMYRGTTARTEEAGAEDGVDVIAQNEKILLGLTQGWCMNHTTDTSGWSFYLWLLHRPHYQGPDGDLVKGYIGSFVLNYATTLQLRNESIWVFLREIARFSVGNNLMVQFANDYLQALSDWKESDPRGSMFAEREILTYNEWCQPGTQKRKRVS